MELSNYAFAATIKNGHTLTIHDAREILLNDKFNATIEGPRYNGTTVFHCIVRPRTPCDNVNNIHKYNGHVRDSDGPYGLWNMCMNVKIDPDTILELSHFDAEVSWPGHTWDASTYTFERLPDLVKGVYDG